IKFVSSRPRKVIAIVRYMVEESSAAIPWLPDWFFLDRVAELIDSHAMVVVTEGEDLRFDVVAAATGLPHPQYTPNRPLCTAPNYAQPCSSVSAEGLRTQASGDLRRGFAAHNFGGQLRWYTHLRRPSWTRSLRFMRHQRPGCSTAFSHLTPAHSPRA